MITIDEIRQAESTLEDINEEIREALQNLRSRAHVEGWSEDSVASIDNDSGDSGADLERDKLREVLAKVEGGEG